MTLGLWQKIKAWFKRDNKSNNSTQEFTQEHSQEYTQEPSKVPVASGSPEIDILVEEHEHLEAERTRLRREIELVDTQYSQGEIAAGDRDRAYRLRLARAGSISIRQMEIRNQLLQKGYPVPAEWGSVHLIR